MIYYLEKKNIQLTKFFSKKVFFYGFHDINPFSEDTSKILANKSSISTEMPTKKDFLKVGYFNFKEQELLNYVEIGETNSWNYHKGCRLQWLTRDSIIFNCTENDKMVSKIVNINDNISTVIPFPIDSVSSDGKFASSFSYERLEKYMPGYGYKYTDEISFLDVKAPKDSGFYIIDLETKKRRLLISLDELANNSRDDENSIESYHYVTHSCFSPSGRYLSFFHRWVGDNIWKRYTKLIIYDLVTNSYTVAPTGYMVSHYVWNKLDEIIVYCNYKGNDCHTLLKIPNLEDSFKVAYPTLNSDGHQSFINNTSFVTDTYADKHRMSKLYSVDIKTNEIVLLASVYSPNKFQTKILEKHIACDLHPRVSGDGRFVCFDTAKSGERSLAVMRL